MFGFLLCGAPKKFPQTLTFLNRRLSTRVPNTRARRNFRRGDQQPAVPALMHGTSPTSAIFPFVRSKVKRDFLNIMRPNPPVFLIGSKLLLPFPAVGVLLRIETKWCCKKGTLLSQVRGLSSMNLVKMFYT